MEQRVTLGALRRKNIPATATNLTQVIHIVDELKGDNLHPPPFQITVTCAQKQCS